MPCSRSSARSPSTVNGPRSSSTRHPARHGRSGGSTRADQEPAGPARRRPRGSVRPVVRKTRSPSDGSSGRGRGERVGPVASRAPGGHARARSTSSGTPAAAQASAACAVIVDAKGCVASTTASMSWSRSQAASPSTPPNPPMRTSPAGSGGVAHPPGQRRHARRTPASTSAAASARASAVPPRIRSSLQAHRHRRVRVEVAVREVLGGQRGPDDHDGGHPDAGLVDRGGQRVERPAQHHLVRAAGVRDDRGRAVRLRSTPLSWRDHLVDAVHRQVQHQRAAGAAQLGQALAVGHRGRQRGDSRQGDGLGDRRHRQLPAQRRGGRGVGGHAGAQVVRHARGVQPPHLLGERGEHRQVAGRSRATSRPGLVRRDHLVDDLGERQVRGVDPARARRAQRQHLRPARTCPAYRQTGDAAMRSRARSVSRSTAPGPAPMKCTVMAWPRSRSSPASPGASR